MKTLCTFIFSLIIFHSAAQKQDYTWIWGGGSTRGVAEHVTMSFKNESREIFVEAIVDSFLPSENSSSISDEEGNLMFYTNGCRMLNRHYQQMENGDSINYTKDGYSIVSDCRRGYSRSQNSFIVPDPKDDTGYYVITKPSDFVDGYENSTGNQSVRASYVQINDTYPEGKVIWKNRIVFESNNLLSSYMHPIQHANGRDWWFIQMEDTTNLHYIFLIDETGINCVDTISIGQKFGRNSSAGGQGKFSPDGKYYARANVEEGLVVYSFDRATGQLSNYQSKPYEKPGVFFSGLEWSASGEFLYLGLSDELFQIDFRNEDLEADYELIATWDGTSNPFPRIFGFMGRGPDCRIYISSISSTKTLHVINDPDQPGMDCDFRQHGIDLLGVSTGTISMPNFPNFRIDIGPPCNPDIATSTSVIPYSPIEEVSYYPNPAIDKVYVDLFDLGDYTAFIYDQSGSLVAQQSSNVQSGIDVSLLPSDIYIIKCLTPDGRAYVGEIVKH